ncbi:MAG: hypothetical protein JKX70_02540 [Phycisphaerales bacterium]|nr:hypothetical protein [Phycisphaerales bacterium]
MSHPDYRVFRMSAHPVFAVPANSRGARLAGISRYQPISPKRAIYRSVMRMATQTGLDRFLSTRVQNPIVNYPDFGFAAWLESIESKLNAGNLSAAIFWPPQIDRGRVYVHLLDTQHQPIAFAKISFNDSNDASLEKEANTLQALTASDLNSFKVPSVLDYQPASPNQHAVLVTQSIPTDARPLAATLDSYPQECVREIAAESTPVSTQGIESCSWWPSYLNRRDTLDPCFVRELEQANTDKTQLCRSHGDFGIANMVQTPNSDLWIFDWEECCQDAPILADEISYFLGVHRPNTLPECESLFERFRAQFLDEKNPQRRIDIMLALAFRSTVNAPKADLIISRWNQF